MKAKLVLFTVPLLGLLAACGAGATNGDGTFGSVQHPNATINRGTAGGSAPTSTVGAPAKASTGLALQTADQAVSQPAIQANVPPLPSAQHLELSATVAVQMPHNKFSDGLDAVVAVISDEHGYLSASDTDSPSGGSLRRGSFTFQVPVDNFQDTLNQLRGVGAFQGLHTSSKQHDAEYVDLQARLKSAQLQLDAFNALLAKASSISDIITIEQQVGQAQQQVEQYQGQLKALDGLTQYATVTVALSEKGAAAAPKPKPATDPWGFASSFGAVVHNLAAIANGFILVLGTLLPFLVIGAVAFVTRRRWMPVLVRAERA